MTSDFFEFKSLSRERLEEILEQITDVKIALIGDICLDVYWKADMTKSLISRETPHFPLPVVKEWMSPGAGGNTAANISELNVSDLEVISVIGYDWRGEALKSEFAKRGIRTDSLISSSHVITNAYCKPLKQGISDTVYEDPRIDFSNFSSLPAGEEKALIEKLEKAAETADAICVCDQFFFGCITQKVRDKISELGKKGIIIAADSRDRIGLYKNITIKPNEIEAGFAALEMFDPKTASFSTYKDAAVKLSQKTGNKVCVTLGEKGGLYVEGEEASYVPASKVSGETDICGAGDAFLSAFTCALATGAKGYEAVAFANLAASVTIKKINTTGTASPEEIRKRHKEIK